MNDYQERINTALIDAVSTGETDSSELERIVEETALGGDDLLYRQLEDYVASAIDLATRLAQAIGD